MKPVLVFGSCEAGGSEHGFVDHDEEAFAASQDFAGGRLDFGLVEELAAFTLEVAAGEDELLVERDGAKIIDLYVACHGEDVERTIEFAHGFVEQSGYDASVDVAGWAFVHAVELEVCGADGVGRVPRVGSEDEMEALWVAGSAAKAVTGALVDGGGGGERIRGVASGVRCH